MYPARDLNRLALHKRALQRRITGRRHECAVAATRLAQPFAWLDRALGLWRRAGPWIQFAAVPLGLLLHRPAMRPAGTAMRWLTVITGILRGVRALRTPPGP